MTQKHIRAGSLPDLQTTQGRVGKLREPLYSVDEAAQILSVSADTFKAAVADGRMAAASMLMLRRNATQPMWCRSVILQAQRQRAKIFGGGA